jgi:hypothetical protein
LQLLPHIPVSVDLWPRVHKETNSILNLVIIANKVHFGLFLWFWWCLEVSDKFFAAYAQDQIPPACE